MRKAKVKKEKDKDEGKYPIDVIEVSNIALAIKNKEQHVTNVEVTVGCRNLPVPNFGEVHNTMIVLFKSCPELL